MGTKSRDRLYGTSVRTAAERATEARREANKLACDRKYLYGNAARFERMALARLSESRPTDAFSVAVWEFGHYCPGTSGGLKY